MTYKQSGMDHDLEVLLLDGKDDMIPTHTIYKERNVSMKSDSKTHSRENHDFYVSRKRKCPYCLSGIPIKEE